MLRNNANGLKFNRAALRDKIHACWIGKNIGGTMGCPIEGKRSVSNISGFTSKGILANDDLDIQLVWLRALDELGSDSINAQTLGEYWLSYVGPWWNEYGICKRNMMEGMLPPLCGAASNEEWEHSNGAWIRTEIWACISPGCPEQAARFAFEDACVDHGFGEGMYAAVFIAAMESAAFVISDINTLLEIGLSKIPADCRIARSVKLVVDSFNKALTWQEARKCVVEDSADLGWMQAPANVAFTVLGLLYGKGDFRQTLIITINCGDDTDCTGATAGSILGIAYGTAGIPEDWKRFMGDSIKTIAVVEGHGEWPATCSELTEGVMQLLPTTTRPKFTYMMPECLPIPESRSDLPVIIHDGEDDFSALELDRYRGSAFMKKIGSIAARSKYAIKQSNVFADLWVELDGPPSISSGETLTGRVTVAIKRMPEQKWFRLRWICLEGWSVSGAKSIATTTKDVIGWDDDSDGRLSGEDLCDWDLASGAFTIHAGENVSANNRIVLEATCSGRPTPIYVPIILMG